MDMCAQELRSAADCKLLTVEKFAGYSTALFHCACAAICENRKSSKTLPCHDDMVGSCDM